MAQPFIKTLCKDLPTLMTGPLSLILLFVPIIAPRLGGRALVWVVAFVCLLVSAYRAWLLEHRARLAEKLDALIEEAHLLSQLWDRIQYDHPKSEFIHFPLAGFDVKEWKEDHKDLLRLYFWTNLQAERAAWRFKELGINERPQLSAVMLDQNLRRRTSGLDYTNLLKEYAALLVRQRQRLAGRFSA